MKSMTDPGVMPRRVGTRRTVSSDSWFRTSWIQAPSRPPPVARPISREGRPPVSPRLSDGRNASVYDGRFADRR